MPITHTMCLGSNAEPVTVRIRDAKGTCPECGKLERIYRDRFGRISILPHKQDGQP